MVVVVVVLAHRWRDEGRDAVEEDVERPLSDCVRRVHRVARLVGDGGAADTPAEVVLPGRRLVLGAADGVVADIEPEGGDHPDPRGGEGDEEAARAKEAVGEGELEAREEPRHRVDHTHPQRVNVVGHVLLVDGLHRPHVVEGGAGEEEGEGVDHAHERRRVRVARRRVAVLVVRAVARPPPERAALVRKAAEAAEQQRGGWADLEGRVGRVPVKDHRHAHAVLEEEGAPEGDDSQQRLWDNRAAEDAREGGEPDGQPDHEHQVLDHVGTAGVRVHVTANATERQRHVAAPHPVARKGKVGVQERCAADVRGAAVRHEKDGRADASEGHQKDEGPQTDPERRRRREALRNLGGGIGRVNRTRARGKLVLAAEQIREAPLLGGRVPRRRLLRLVP
mmetsp:Transcript_45276/g.147118  ORF Transcript_45276/g.147118 Transcript_45276/m.147118 type:complete len:394 (-) Transcript_45276:89-1270(-)